MEKNTIKRFSFDTKTLIIDIKNYLQKNIDKKRYAHSLQVARVAKELASGFGVSPEKAEIAGLMHDYSRYLSNDQMVPIALRYGYLPDEVEMICPILIHSYISSAIAREEYNITDEEILSAIENHTTGDVSMGLLDKIIYIADYIEPNRNLDPLLLEEIKLCLFEDIDKAMLLVLDRTIAYLDSAGKVIHPRTLRLKLDLQARINDPDV